MLDNEFSRLYFKFRLLHFQHLFGRVKEKAGSLSATEAYTVEVIYLLDKPTASELADFLDISQSNVTYKINALISKGYIMKETSPEDRREIRLNVTEKFLNYYGCNSDFIKSMLGNIKSNFTEDEVKLLEHMIKKVTDEALH